MIDLCSHEHPKLKALSNRRGLQKSIITRCSEYCLKSRKTTKKNYINITKKMNTPILYLKFYFIYKFI